MEIRQPAPVPSQSGKPVAACDDALIAAAKAELEKALKSKGARQRLRNATAQICAANEKKETGK